MSKEKPTDDPREQTDGDQTKGTDAPWDRPNQKAQNPNEADTPKPDLERWQKSNTH